MVSSWTLVAYRTPTEPSTTRVAVWRALHRMGALYLGPSVCLVPAALADGTLLERLRARVEAAGGSLAALEDVRFGPEAEAELRRRYNAARAAEYAEIVEQAEAVVAELEREGRRNKFTFAEVEENEAGLAKLRRWLRRVSVRDLFGCGARQEAEAAVEGAARRLAVFVDEAIVREAEGASTAEAGIFDLRIGDPGR